MVFLALLFIPILISIFAFIFLKKYGERTINIKEFLISLGVQIAVAGVSAFIISQGNSGDIEIWNGTIAKKVKDKVSCSHSYSCNCRQVRSCSGSGKTRSCSTSTVCDTCYEHSYDIDWNLLTTNRERINISRVDRQGLKQPPRWVAAKVGEPTAVKHNFKNYIKAAPGTLFKREGFEGYSVPKYPDNVYDYHHLNRIVTDGISVDNLRKWNHELSVINGELGKSKQVNLIVVLTKQNKDFFYALQQAWVGGKKNDVVLVIGAKGKEISWVNVMAWSQDKNLETNLRHDIMDIETIDMEKILAVYKEDVVKYFKRKPMKDFEYLKSSITPTLLQWIISLVIGFIIAIILAVIFHIYEV